MSQALWQLLGIRIKRHTQAVSPCLSNTGADLRFYVMENVIYHSGHLLFFVCKTHVFHFGGQYYPQFILDVNPPPLSLLYPLKLPILVFYPLVMDFSRRPRLCNSLVPFFGLGWNMWPIWCHPESFLSTFLLKLGFILCSLSTWMVSSKIRPLALQVALPFHAKILG